MGLFQKAGASNENAASSGDGGAKSLPPSLAARGDVQAASAGASPSKSAADPPRRGRPPGKTDSVPRKIRGVEKKAVAKIAGMDGASDVPTIDPGVVQSALRAGLKSIDQIVARRVEKTVLILTGDANEARDMAAETALQKAEVEEIPKLAAYCLGRHGALGEYAPEVLLACLVGGYVVRVGVTFRKLDDIARIQRAGTQKAEQGKSVTDQGAPPAP